jgi:hypothetical protein
MLRDGQLVPQLGQLRAVAECTAELNAAAITLQQADDDLHQRAFPGAVLTDESDQLARSDFQAGAPEDLHPGTDRPEPVTKRLRDLGHDQ